MFQNMSLRSLCSVSVLCTRNVDYRWHDMIYIVLSGHILVDPPSLLPQDLLNMAFLYEPKNSNLAKLIIRLQREDIEALTTGDENIDLALNLQLEELRITETLIADHRVAVDCQLEPDRDRELALALAVTRHEAIAALLTCTGCESLFTRHQSFKAPCDRHFYCFECLANFFEYTIGDETLYPPKYCDHEILFDNVKTLLDEKLVARYADKKIEYDTEPSKRTYCSGSNCSTFVPETSIQDEVATCSSKL